jgi:hypothetical protein
MRSDSYRATRDAAAELVHLLDQHRHGYPHTRDDIHRAARRVLDSSHSLIEVVLATASLIDPDGLPMTALYPHPPAPVGRHRAGVSP